MSQDRVTKLDRNIAKMNESSSGFSMIPYNNQPQSIVFYPHLAYGFSTDSINVGPEKFTGISGFYDYKTNGEVNIYVQVDPQHPDTIQVVDVVADTLDPQGSTSRRTRWTYTTDGGNTWQTSIDVPENLRSGYPQIVLKNGVGIIANHNAAISGQLNVNIYEDLAPIVGAFTEKTHPTPSPFGIWPQLTVYNNGNVGILGRRNVSGNEPETLLYSVYNGTSVSAWTPVYFTTNNYISTVGSNMRFHLDNNGNGRATMIIAPVLQNDTLENSRMYARTTTDNGSTWGPVETVFRPYTVNSGNDTVSTAGGSGFTCKPNTNNWYLAYPIATDGLFASGELVITKSDGTTHTITNATDVGAATTYAQNMAFVFNIDFPGLGWSADGTTLYCVYSVVKPDTSRGFNQRDIYFQYSLDDAVTWSTPLRITNTPNIDETYPSISKWNRGAPGTAYEVNITYMKDPGVGPTSFNGTGTTAPASMNFQVYRKLVGTPPIGINNNQTTLRDYKLGQNYPNPFNPSTKIEYNIIKSGLVTLKVYDVLGREVATLVNEFQTAGAKQLEFDASNLTSGVYFYKISADNFSDTKKMTLIK